MHQRAAFSKKKIDPTVYNAEYLLLAACLEAPSKDLPSLSLWKKTDHLSHLPQKAFACHIEDFQHMKQEGTSIEFCLPVAGVSRVK